MNYQRDRSVAGGFPHQRLQLVSTLKMVLSWGDGGAPGGQFGRVSTADTILSLGTFSQEELLYVS